MTSTQLTTAEVTAFNQKAFDYIQIAPSVSDWAPVVRIPECEIYSYKKATRVPRGASSKYGTAYKEVEMAYTPATANVHSWVWMLNIPRPQVEIARKNNVPIWDDNFNAIYRHAQDSIAHLCLEGSEVSLGDTVAISGLRDGGTDIGATTDALLWGTVTKPTANAAAISAALNTAGFGDERFSTMTWILSSNARTYMKTKYGAGDEMEEDIIKKAFFPNIHYLPMGTSTEMTTYPIAPASANDIVFFAFPKSPDVWHIAEVMPLTVTLNPNLNPITNCYQARFEWRGTVAIVQATGVQYSNSGDIS